MNYLIISVLGLLTLTGCAAMMPDMFKTIDDIATDDAISISVDVDRDAIKADTDVKITLNVDVTNKDEPAPAPVINVTAPATK